ncbi:uncharacterized protein LOC111397501 isoform X1 [Olea europaea var. sylvestris]|uniref:uncharacterized protein LOC111397501 isoform X1 n=1 Tax=Olea europaea var. sylvestris TaxID=158386 RepID=UPI000C1D42D9|nr:uncharacterized protein LOC111397501 isoform X1 [Olea europaea var. sylvestris]
MACSNAKEGQRFHPRGDGPFHVIERIENNSYNLDLQGKFVIIYICFDVSYLAPFYADTNSRLYPFEKECNDTIQVRPQSYEVQVQLEEESMTRLQVNRINEAMHLLAQIMETKEFEVNKPNIRFHVGLESEKQVGCIGIKKTKLEASWITILSRNTEGDAVACTIPKTRG